MNDLNNLKDFSAKQTKKNRINMKKEYMKPEMAVYRLKAQPQLLAGSPLQQSLPQSDIETLEQW